MAIKAEDVVYDIKVTNLQQDRQGVAVMGSCTVTATCGSFKGQSTHTFDLLPPTEGAKLIPALEIEQTQAVPWLIAAANAPGKIGIEGMKHEALAALVRQQAPKTTAIPLAWLV